MPARWAACRAYACRSPPGGTGSWEDDGVAEGAAEMKSGGGVLRKPVSGGAAVVSTGVGPEESAGMKSGGGAPALRKPVSGGAAVVLSGCGAAAWSTEMNSGGADGELAAGAGVGVGV